MNSEANPETVRISIERRDSYGIMWLAGIRHVDLGQHCLKTFGECDRPSVNHRLKRQTLLLPPQNRPAAWYLCALPIPWDWSRNAHIAFEYCRGEEWEGPALVPGLKVQLSNARPIEGWGEHSIPAEAPFRQVSRFRTCRNWQFGWWLKNNRGVPEALAKASRDSAELGGPRQLAFE
ncbi:hypothetical protein ACFW6V_28510 [Streptomyces sp. NPDC058734]|uniref:hypothetical protein n=1 Tax=Streptomyces sp. NPDC058734 TaxID=3346615 RepID=UPI0036A3C50F